MAFEEMFHTERGSIYSFDWERLLWQRVRADGSVEQGLSYVGSINPYRNLTLGSGSWGPILAQWQRGGIPGFVPEFRIGFHPLGVGVAAPSISELGQEVVKVREGSVVNAFHVGSKISEIINGKFCYPSLIARGANLE